MTTTVTATIVGSETEFSQILDDKLKDQATYDAVETTFKKLLNTQVKNEVIKEIRQLKQTVKDIDDAFQRIGSDFLRFDRRKYRDENGEVLELRPRWTEYHNRFKSILEQSRQNAVQASARLEYYCGYILPAEEFTFDDLEYTKAELQIFKEELNAKHQTALDTQNSFKSLAEDLRSYYVVIEDAAVAAGARLVDELRSSQRRIVELQDRLDAVSKKMRIMGVAAVSCVAVGAAAAGAAIFTLSPIALGIAVAAVCAAIGTAMRTRKAKLEADGLEEEIQKCKAEITELTEKEKQLKEFQEGLGKTKEDVRALADRVDVFTNIWQSLKADMQKLEEQIEIVLQVPTAAGASETVPEGESAEDKAQREEKERRAKAFRLRRFTTRLGVTRDVYSNLAVCLHQYAQGASRALEDLSED